MDRSRRWFRFSLLTLFVAVVAMLCLVTMLCLWLGWEAQIVWHRRALRQQIVAAGGAAFSGPIAIDFLSTIGATSIRHGNRKYKVSALRMWLGDERVDFIGYNRRRTDDDRRALDAFPETIIHALPDGPVSLEFDVPADDAPECSFDPALPEK